jgi:protein-tyrosine phosphatase
MDVDPARTRSALGAESMPNVLFVCTGNLYRSQFAAAFFQSHLQAGDLPGWRVESAGTWTRPGRPLPPDAIQAAAKFKVDLTGRRSQLVDRTLLAGFDLILVMEQGHKEALCHEFPEFCGRIHLLSMVVEKVVYDIPDPVFPGQDVESSALSLYNLVQQGFEDICRLARDGCGPDS